MITYILVGVSALLLLTIKHDLRLILGELRAKRLLFIATLEREGKLYDTEQAFRRLENAGMFHIENWTPEGVLKPMGNLHAEDGHRVTAP